MKTSNWTLLTAAVAAAAMAAALSAPAFAQTAAHDHSAAMPHKLTLNEGHKWATDESLRTGMGRIRGLVEPQLGAAHAGKLTPRSTASWPRRSRPRSAASSPTASSNRRPTRCCTW